VAAFAAGSSSIALGPRIVLGGFVWLADVGLLEEGERGVGLRSSGSAWLDGELDDRLRRLRGDQRLDDRIGDQPASAIGGAAVSSGSRMLTSEIRRTRPADLELRKRRIVAPRERKKRVSRNLVDALEVIPDAKLGRDHG
jgi:hypothetical protein